MTSTAETGLRWRVAAVIGVAVLAAHGWLLGLWPQAPGPGWRAEPARPLQVRQIRLAAVPVQPAAQVAMSPVLAAPAAPAVATPPSPARPAAPDQATAAVAAETPPSPPDAEPTAPPGGVDLPIYATRMPPAIVLSFDLPAQRGQPGAQATLRWQPSATGYTLTLLGESPGLRLPGGTSQGGFDAAGVAPERYVESRRGRELRAANFQRQAGDGGRITFSGPQVEYPLLAGAQDRLSWIIQLAAVLAANPALTQAGEQVSMFVAGARGDGEVWVFAVVGPETVELADGQRVEALRLQREPRRLYDTQVQVWVDPARHHLPVRLRLTVRANGQGSELLLRQAAQP